MRLNPRSHFAPPPTTGRAELLLLLNFRRYRGLPWNQHTTSSQVHHILSRQSITVLKPGRVGLACLRILHDVSLPELLEVDAFVKIFNAEQTADVLLLAWCVLGHVSTVRLRGV